MVEIEHSSLFGVLTTPTRHWGPGKYWSHRQGGLLWDAQPHRELPATHTLAPVAQPSVSHLAAL